MALTTYAELQTAVAAWLHRETTAAAQVQEFIRLAEEQLTADLADLPLMQRSPTPIALTPPATTFVLPDDIASLLSVRLVEIDKALRIVSGANLKREATNVSSVPAVCAISGSNDNGELLVAVRPYPASAYTVQVTGTAAIPALSVSRPSNFVLERAPSLYLYGSLLAAEAFCVNDPRLPTWQAMYDRALVRFTGLDWDGDIRLSTDLPVSRPTFDINQG
jgi:hypothetical protein